MLIYTLKRLLVALAVLVSVTIVTFTLLQVSGDPAVALAGPEASDEDIEFVRTQYGFDKPLPVQYLTWANRVVHGDLGTSVYLKKPVFDVITKKIPVTATLAACSLAFALLLAIPLGVAAAMHPNTVVDRVALALAVVGQALPNFFFALILILVFGVSLGMFPISGSSTWKHYVLPAIALGYYSTPAIMRLTRAGMLEVLASDYIRTARAKGLRQRVMIAMALLCEPSLLIADEPTTALDVTIQAQILSLIRSIQREMDIGVILITHDLGVVARIADRVAVMYAGQIIESGSAKEVFDRPRHPYTRGLLDCIPVPGKTVPGQPLGSIPGIVPSLVGEVRGCAFLERCTIAAERCADGVDDQALGEAHYFRCNANTADGGGA